MKRQIQRLLEEQLPVLKLQNVELEEKAGTVLIQIHKAPKMKKR